MILDPIIWDCMILLQVAPKPRSSCPAESEYISSTSATKFELKSKKGLENTIGWCKNWSHMCRSALSSALIFMWWCFFSLGFLVYAYIHLVNALPGTIALPRKFRKPVSSCSSWTVVSYFSFPKWSQLAVSPLESSPVAAKLIVLWYLSGVLKIPNLWWARQFCLMKLEN